MIKALDKFMDKSILCFRIGMAGMLLSCVVFWIGLVFVVHMVTP